MDIKTSARFRRASVHAAMAALVLLQLGLSDPLLGRQDVAAPEGEAKPTHDRPAAPPFLDEITVTAQKREENVQDVPIAVTALSKEQIEDVGIRSMEDLFALLPNASLTHSFTVGNSFVTVRGISQLNNSDSPIAVVVDGVYQGNQKQLIQELYDIERIEFLRGPQGALYGRNSLGGVLNVITRPPQAKSEGWLRGSAGNGSSFGLAAAVGGKMADGRLLFRGAASHKESDGLIENVFLQKRADPYEDTAGRLQLTWLLTQGLELDLRAASSESRGGAVIYSIFPGSGFANRFDFEPDENILGFSHRDMRDLSLRGVWKPEAGTLTAILGFSDVEEIFRGDGDFSNLARNLAFPLGQVATGQDLDVRMLSHELRWSSPDDRRLRWLTGIYVLDTDRALKGSIFADTNGTFAGFVPLLVAKEDNDNIAYSAFAESSYDATAAWNVAAALRYDRDSRHQTDLQTGVRRRRSFAAWQPKLTASYHAPHDLMTYVTISSGFRSGGFNAPGATPEHFEKEISRNIEVGLKSLVAGGRIRLNSAVYEMLLSDAQFFLVDLARGGQLIDNLREAKIRGVEIDAAARLASRWDAYFALGINDAEIEDFDGSNRFVGNQMPYNVRSKVNFGAQYLHPLTEGLLGSARADLEWRGKQYWTADNLDIQDPVHVLNLRIGIEARLWKLAAWIRNVTDERYYVEYLDGFWMGGAIGPNDLGQLALPRTYGVEITRHF